MDAVTGHPTCPRCQMPALRLVLDGQACDWCRDREPVTRTVWDDMLARVEAHLTAKTTGTSGSVDRECVMCEGVFTVARLSKRTVCSKDCENDRQRERMRDSWQEGKYEAIT